MKTQEFNIQDYLSTKTDRRLFLIECFRQDKGDGSLITAALKDVVEAAGTVAIAEATGIAEKTLTRALGKGATLPFMMVMSIAGALGVTLKAKKGKVRKVKKVEAEKPAEAPAPAEPAKAVAPAKAKKAPAKAAAPAKAKKAPAKA